MNGDPKSLDPLLRADGAREMADSAEAKQTLKDEANALAKSLDADLLIFNYEIVTPADFSFMAAIAARSVRRKNLLLFLTTEGGSADSAFRMMRLAQTSYERITIVVAGWCKSAGTLMSIGAHELIMANLGELGPLDVQIVKADELDEQKSGLVAEAAFEKLQQEAFKFFMGFVRDIGGSEYRVTLKTASEIASRMTTGVLQPIFDKLDPVTIGEDYRSNRLAQAYAERLNAHSKNLKSTRDIDGLDNLLSGYPSHGFVIDVKEAALLFKNVKPLPKEMAAIIRCLGMDAVLPRNGRREQSPRLEFLNDEAKPSVSAGKSPAGDADAGSAKASSRRRSDASELPRNLKARGSKKATSANGTARANGSV